MLSQLDWVPKRFGPGDTDGAGARRQLGQPTMDLQTLLVREMAQNSWDARLGCGNVPLFELRIESLGPSEISILRDHVFAGGSSPSLGLNEALSGGTLRALTVLDRRTKGLGGPTRNDVSPTVGSVTDYIDFVLNVGAPPDNANGGGTYGFGKTAAYVASRCSTIVIWSRSRKADGQFDERFIASAMGESFTIDGYRYTGRQWWGREVGSSQAGGIIEPVVGIEARLLGEAIFSRSFEANETGTSIMIIDPKPAISEEGDCRIFASAIARNLWPKLGTDQDLSRQMEIHLFDAGVEVPILSASEEQVVRVKRQCLDAIRSVQAGEELEPSNVRLISIEYGKGHRTLGHLALQRMPIVVEGRDSEWLQHVTLMRNAVEIRVSEFPGKPIHLPDELMQWTGVFKPVEGLDFEFAEAEPPTHDSWNYQSIQDASRKSHVKTALRKVEQLAKGFIHPVEAPVQGGTSLSVGGLSAELGGLIVGSGGARATARTGRHRVSRGGGGVRGQSPRVVVVGVEPMGSVQNGDFEETRVKLRLENVDSPKKVNATKLAIAVEGPPLRAPDLVFLDRWCTVDGWVSGADGVLIAPSSEVSAYIRYGSGLAIDFTFEVVDFV